MFCILYDRYSESVRRRWKEIEQQSKDSVWSNATTFYGTTDEEDVDDVDHPINEFGYQHQYTSVYNKKTPFSTFHGP